MDIDKCLEYATNELKVLLEHTHGRYGDPSIFPMDQEMMDLYP